MQSSVGIGIQCIRVGCTFFYISTHSFSLCHEMNLWELIDAFM